KVVLSEYDIVQPDVFVVCDKNKITDRNIQGAPDLVVEVLSPFTALKVEKV
ncbi:MAG: Uma2 family endonuclease, partial [Planctomycetota bacterium]